MRALALALPLLLAGCFSEPTAAPAEDAPEGAAAPLAAGVDGAPLAGIARFAGEAQHFSVWENGTFRIDRASRVHNELPRIGQLAENSIVRFDVTQHVPTGVPFTLIAQVDAAVNRGDVDLWVEMASDEFRTGNWDAPYGGYTRFEVGAFRSTSEPVVVVLAYDEMDDQVEFPYTVQIHIVADPEVLLHGMPVAIELPADARFDVELVGAAREGERGAPGLVVFAPDDTFVGRFDLSPGTTTLELPPGSPAGEYVVLLSQGGRDARILGPNAPLRVLAQEYTFTDTIIGDSAGHVAWTTDYATPPLLAGVLFRSPSTGVNLAVRLATPAGVLFEDTIEGGMWWSARLPDGTSFESNFWWDSGFGVRELVAGTYEGEITFEPAAGPEHVEATPFWATYTR